MKWEFMTFFCRFQFFSPQMILPKRFVLPTPICTGTLKVILVLIDLWTALVLGSVCVCIYQSLNVACCSRLIGQVQQGGEMIARAAAPKGPLHQEKGTGQQHQLRESGGWVQQLPPKVGRRERKGKGQRMLCLGQSISLHSVVIWEEASLLYEEVSWPYGGIPIERGVFVG